MRIPLLIALCATALLENAYGETVIRVLSYNIHHAEGTDGVLDVERIARVIRAVSPDVVCLQEVDRGLPRTEMLDMPALLADALSMHVAFEANYLFDGGEYGNATLSTHPIVSAENTALPNPNDAEPRGCLRTALDVGGTMVRVFNTHLGLKPDERMEQASAIAELVGNDGMAVVAGDLNATPESGPLKVLLGGLRDSGAGVSPTSSSTNPRRRIDYVLVSPEMRVVESRTLRGEETTIASDHLPSLTVLALPETSTPRDATAEFNAIQPRKNHD